MTSRLRIIVGGLGGLYPVGGVAWDYLMYVVGLARLGHDVFYHEDTWSWPYHPIERQQTDHGDYSAGYIRNFFDHYAPDLAEHWHYRHLRQESFGMDRKAFDEVARSADIFLNVSGACIIPDEIGPGCVKVFLDTDPGYNQIMLRERFAWSENVDRWCASVESHDQHFTYAENIHGKDCLIPTSSSLKWKTTRVPMDLGAWRTIAETVPPRMTPWTTVMTWNAFKGPLVYEGVEYKSKGSEFEKLLGLPQRVKVPLQVAVGGLHAPLAQLEKNGWKVIDGPRDILTPGQYQDFIATSRGELSAAKHVYVAMRTGWFSGRSTCYLCGGRPVITQDTGFSNTIPTGRGVFGYNSVDDILGALDRVESDYETHRRAALAVADEYFEAGKVLRRLLADLGVSQ